MENEMKQVELSAEEFDAQLERMREELGDEAFNKQFYDYVRENDTQNEWIFLLSGNYLEETDNIRVFLREDVKKSSIHKIIFDCFTGAKYINSLKPDVVFSLQNIITFGVKVPQFVYVHQSIPFQNVKDFSFFKAKERKIAVIQKLIGAFIIQSVKSADGVIVQTEWMKNAVASKANVNVDKIITAFPVVQRIECITRNYEKINKRFFYPTNNELYKNIDTIIRACKVLNEEGVDNFEVCLTLPSGMIEHENIKCVGYLDSQQMAEMYSCATMIFPSYMETIGLPLVEAQLHKTLIYAADCPYAREVLQGYDNAYYFDVFDYKKLAEMMKKRIYGEIAPDLDIKCCEHRSGWGDVYGFITLQKKQ